MARPNDTENIERTDSFSSVSQVAAQKTAPETFHPILICMSGAHRGCRYKIEDASTVIGRSRETDIQISDAGASRRHSEILYENFDNPRQRPICYIQDMGSRNGTELNGKRVHERAAMSERDRITIGRTIFGFFFRDSEELLQDESLYENATRDSLTGLDNRLQMLSHLKHYIALGSRRPLDLCLLLLDIDRFKLVNDTYGHQVGDEALRHLSRLLLNCSRESDLVARWGGEEFAISVPDNSLESARLYAERLRYAVESSPLTVGDITLSMTVSIGVTELRKEDTLRTFFERSDRALYQAKAAGRNKVVVATEPMIHGEKDGSETPLTEG
ncbi:GGDEF domain-containing protein [soil metagenome]